MPGPLTRPEPGSRPHLLALDGLRGVAILSVMVFHLYSPIGSWTTKVTSYGGLGVNLFFALSGFLITGILLDAKGHRGYFKNFYARRALRIWPLYYGVLWFLLVLIPHVHAIHDAKYEYSVAHQVWLWVYANNFYEVSVGRAIPLFGHFWSLAVEEQFYLVWPAVVFVSSRRGLLWICAACVLESFGSRFAMLRLGVLPALMIRLTFCQLDSLAVGAALSVFIREGTGLERLRRPANVAAGATALFVITENVFPQVAASNWRLAASGTFWSAAFGAMLVAALGGYGRSAARWFEARALRFLGKYSYGIYVFHWPIGRLVATLFPSSAKSSSVMTAVAFMCLAMGASIGAAYVSWHLFEKHFLRLKRYFENHRGTSVVAGR